MPNLQPLEQLPIIPDPDNGHPFGWQYSLNGRIPGEAYFDNDRARAILKTAGLVTATVIDYIGERTTTTANVAGLLGDGSILSGFTTKRATIAAASFAQDGDESKQHAAIWINRNEASSLIADQTRQGMPLQKAWVSVVDAAISVGLFKAGLIRRGCATPAVRPGIFRLARLYVRAGMGGILWAPINDNPRR